LFEFLWAGGLRRAVKKEATCAIWAQGVFIFHYGAAQKSSSGSEFYQTAAACC